MDKRAVSLSDLRDLGIEPFPLRCTRTHLVKEARALRQAGRQRRVTLAGRVVALSSDRLRLADASGAAWLEHGLQPPPRHTVPVAPSNARLKAGTRREEQPVLLSPREIWPLLQVGDIIQAEVTMEAAAWRLERAGLLAKALRSTPWSSHPGSPDTVPGEGATLDTLARRARVLAAIRAFFDHAGFLEVETPIMATHPGLEPNLDPFEARYRETPAQPGTPVFLLTSPEYAMKRLVAAGVDKVFQVSRVFRNGELGPFHNPEFTLLEWYRAFASYRDIQKDLEALVRFVAGRLGLEGTLHWRGHTVDLSAPWQTITVHDAIRDATGIDLETHETGPGLAEACRGIGVDVPGDASWDEAFFRLLADRVEPRLGFGKPALLVDYPPRLAALAKTRGGSRPVAERFELYIAGVEVANAYTELNDPLVQRARFEDERALRRRMGAPVFDPDPGYLETLEAGLPPCGGIAVGVDRLVMLLLDVPDTRHTMAFPFFADAGH